MPINRVIARPNVFEFTTQGRVFQLLNGAQVHLRFRGIGDSWSEEVDLVVGDSLKFERDFTAIEISSEYETPIEFYAGFADMRRATTDLSPVGSSTLFTGSVKAEKVQKILVPERRNRRSVTILPLDGMVYIGALGSNINEQVPVVIGQPLTLDVKSAVYVQLEPTHTNETVDIRFLEEIN